MGNRAVITFDNARYLGVYLHWNGGRDSVEAFLLYCKLQSYRFQDYTYGLARLTQVVTNFFGGSTCVGVGCTKDLDCNNGDNGLYIVKDWKITERKYFEGQEQTEYDIFEFIKSIDMKMPKEDRLFTGKRKITQADVDKILKVEK